MLHEYWMWKSEIAPEVCDKIVLDHKDGASEGAVFMKDGAVVDHEVRRSKTNFNVDPDARRICSDYLFGANRSAFGVDLGVFVDVQFTMYEGSERGFYDWHVDSYGSARNVAFNRKLSCVIALSDPNDYEGGEFYLGYGTKPFKFLKGDVIVFPSFKPHKVAPVVKGTRYTLVSWAEGPDWR